METGGAAPGLGRLAPRALSTRRGRGLAVSAGGGCGGSAGALLHGPFLRRSPAHLHSEFDLFRGLLLPIRPINFPFPEFQAARRVKHLTLVVAGYPLVTLTGMSADAGFPRQRHS